MTQKKEGKGGKIKEISDLSKDIAEKYKKIITSKINIEKEVSDFEPIKSSDYESFKKEYLPKSLDFYEKWCRISEKFFKISPDKKTADKINKFIEFAHINVTSTGVTSFSMLSALVIALLGGMIGAAIGSTFVTIFFILTALILIIVFNNIPEMIATKWRMNASNQMVLSIFYIVTYMRHTSNLEGAIKFASEHLGPPLSLDLRKVLWDVETQKYSNIKESLDNYLRTWEEYNKEFVESIHLIESSLMEGSDSRRLDLLDKALSTMLSETYEKMLHYAHDLKSPITMIHMLGVVLPILGLVILPLVVSFMDGVKWYHLGLMYNIALPLIVYFFGKNILSKRPSGYGNEDISQKKEFKKYSNILFKVGNAEVSLNPFFIAVIVFFFFLLLGATPLIMHIANPQPGWEPFYFNNPVFEFLGYIRNDAGDVIGPYGIGAAILSFGYVLAIGLGLGIFYKLRSQNIIKIRNETKKLEGEFASTLFQLGNRLGDGIPAEIAFQKISMNIKDSPSGRFFKKVSDNIIMGVGLEESIFNPQYGAINDYPSKIISSAMKVLVQSIKKGPAIAANAIINVANYIKEMHKVDERLRDLMADIVSSMKSQAYMISPVISGIVIGITSMIITIINNLKKLIANLSVGGGAGGMEGITQIVGLFQDSIPTYYFQIIVGIYVVQIVFILIILINGIENGDDKLTEKYLLGQGLIKTTLLYLVIGAFVMIFFNIVASNIVGSLVVS